MTTQTTMSPRIAELARELLSLTENPTARPTESDRNKLMAVRNKVKRLPDEVELTETEETDRQYLYVVATTEANRQEDFYESNGNKWAQ